MEDAYTNRFAPAFFAARNAWSVPSTLISRSASREAFPVMLNARWTTTSAPWNACSSASWSRTSPWRYSILCQPFELGTNGRRAIPMTFPTRSSSSRSGMRPDPKVPVGPVTATVSGGMGVRLPDRGAKSRHGVGASAQGLIPGDPQHPLAAGLEERLTVRVPFVVVVPAGPVGLDDEPPRGPPEVGNQPSAGHPHGHVHVRPVEPGFLDEVEHRVFEGAPRWRWAVLQEGGEPGGAAAALALAQRRRDPAEVDPP